MPVGTRFEWHAHGDHQLAWSPEGVLVVLTESGGSYVLPPSRSLWIPSGTVHETRASGAAVLRSVYVEPRRCPIDWDAPTPVAVSPLLGELIHHLDDREIEAEERARAEAVLFDLLMPLRIATIDVRSPADPRAARRRRRAPRRPGQSPHAARVGTHRRSEQPHTRACLPPRHRALVWALAHTRPPARLAAVPRRADAGERGRAARRLRDDERLRRRVPRPHRRHARPLLPAARASGARKRLRPRRVKRRAARRPAMVTRSSSATRSR